VEDLGLPRTSFLANLTIDNDDDFVNESIGDKLLVNVDAADATNIVGDKGFNFFLDTKYKAITTSKTASNQTNAVHLQQRCSSKKR
jgi:hypothetical protein